MSETCPHCGAEFERIGENGMTWWECGTRQFASGHFWVDRGCLQRQLARLRAIVDLLDKTEDGVPITPQTELWQCDPRGMIYDGAAWQCGDDWDYMRVENLPVYSTQAAAEAAQKPTRPECGDTYADMHSDPLTDDHGEPLENSGLDT